MNNIYSKYDDCVMIVIPSGNQLHVNIENYRHVHGKIIGSNDWFSISMPTGITDWWSVSPVEKYENQIYKSSPLMDEKKKLC